MNISTHCALYLIIFILLFEQKGNYYSSHHHMFAQPNSGCLGGRGEHRRILIETQLFLGHMKAHSPTAPCNCTGSQEGHTRCPETCEYSLHRLNTGTGSHIFCTGACKFRKTTCVAKPSKYGGVMDHRDCNPAVGCSKSIAARND